MRLTTRTLIAIAALTLAASTFAADTIKIAHIDPMSGPFGLAGQTLSKHFDNKASAQDSVTLLQQIIDSGIRYVIQGGGSNVAHALSDTLAKYNSRNPEKAVLYLNYAAQDPALTNEKCNFWHFRFDAHVVMKLDAITNHIARQKNITKVYLLN